MRGATAATRPRPSDSGACLIRGPARLSNTRAGSSGSRLFRDAHGRLAVGSLVRIDAENARDRGFDVDVARPRDEEIDFREATAALPPIGPTRTIHGTVTGLARAHGYAST